MYEKGSRKGTVRFKVKPRKEARSIALAGDFNGWKPVLMRQEKDGCFCLTVAVPPGRHGYKYVVDGCWLHDPDVPEVVMNCYGTFNSVVSVG